MTDRPILFSAPMVRALLDGRKTQTRRVLTSLKGKGRVSEFGPSDTAGYDWHFRDQDKRWHDVSTERLQEILRWHVGDRLWVRETLRRQYANGVLGETWLYSADQEVVNLRHGDPRITDMIAWAHHKEGDTCVSIHLPRWASRLTLTVTDVRVQRLQEIDLRDAWAEGCEIRHFWLFGANQEERDNIGRNIYRSLWEEINGAGSWDANPWVVAVTFTVDRRNIDALPMPYLIWSNVHGAWWGANRAGYYTELSSAGRYTREEAIAQCANGRDGFTAHRTPPELPVREIDALNRGGRRIEDLVLKADRAECRARDLASKTEVPK